MGGHISFIRGCEEDSLWFSNLKTWLGVGGWSSITPIKIAGANLEKDDLDDLMEGGEERWARDWTTWFISQTHLTCVSRGGSA